MTARRIPLAVHGGKLFVRLDHSGILPFVAAVDGLPQTFFRKEKTAYLSVETVIAWHESEIAHTQGRSGKPDALAAFKSALEKFRRGHVVPAA